MEAEQLSAQPHEGGMGRQGEVHPMSEYLDQDYARMVPRHGDVVEGVIVSITPAEVLSRPGISKASTQRRGGN